MRNIIKEKLVFQAEDGSKRKQIANYFREAIQTGELRPGEKLPGMRVLAEKLGVGVGSIQWAMKQLANEGLLTSCSNFGTIINSQKKLLKTIGVFVYSHDNTVHTPFFALLLDALKRESVSRKLRICITHENLNEQSVTSIRDGYKRQNFQVALILGIHPLIAPEVDKLTLPYVVLTRTLDQHFGAEAIKVIQEKGGRKLAFLHTTPEDQWPKVRKILLKETAKRGLEFDPLHDVYTSESDILNKDQEALQKVGYELTCRMWSNPLKRPDSLLVYPDDLVPGVLMAILALGINVPQDLKLFLHRNAECKTFCPLECVFIENRIADFANILLADCIAKYDGKLTKKETPSCINYQVFSPRFSP